MEECNLVMVIDDDAELLKEMASALEGFYEVSLAKSGETALRLLEREPLPDIILLDIDMPGMDGYEVMRRLRAWEKTAPIPVIFLTGLPDEEIESICLRLGAADFIRKPPNPENLRTRLDIRLGDVRKFREKGGLDEEKLRALPRPLVGRELEVAKLMAGFYTDEKMAEMLCLSLSRTKALAASVRDKLGLEKKDDIRRYLK